MEILEPYVEYVQSRQKRPERPRSGFLIVYFEHISHIALVFLLLTLSKQMPAGMKVNITYPNMNCSVAVNQNSTRVKLMSNYLIIKKQVKF